MRMCRALYLGGRAVSNRFADTPVASTGRLRRARGDHEHRSRDPDLGHTLDDEGVGRVHSRDHGTVELPIDLLGDILPPDLAQGVDQDGAISLELLPRLGAPAI